ncbi:MAG: hypothetical protein ABIX37_00500 [Gammaproteobacteria bacterium]
MNKVALVMLSAFAVGIAGCGKKPAAPTPTVAPPPVTMPVPAPAGVAVTNLTIGNAIDPDKKVTGSSTTLGKNDTFYVSIATTGSGTANLKAKWTYQPAGDATVVKEEALTINATGPATSEFHVDKPDGWPAGDYQVEAFVNDVPAGSRQFTVK